jgi:SAM-dependent methyltransferase
MDLTEVPDAPFRRHPWEIARARFFGRIVQADGTDGGAATRRVLDVGAGDGYLGRLLLQRMPAGSSVDCVDPNYTDQDLRRLGEPPAEGLRFARARPPGPFDLVLLLDVIEHVADDRAFLDEILSASVAPGGTVLVSVPAWDLLYSQHDVELKHFRRYSPDRCRALLEASGLSIVRSGGLFHSLLLPRVAQRLIETVQGALRVPSRDRPANLGEWRGGRLVSAAVGLALAADNRLSELAARSGRQLPGLSYWALCRKVAA